MIYSTLSQSLLSESAETPNRTVMIGIGEDMDPALVVGEERRLEDSRLNRTSAHA